MPKRINIFAHENIVFEGKNKAETEGDSIGNEDHDEEYRKRFEQALIQIEDREDVLAY